LPFFTEKNVLNGQEVRTKHILIHINRFSGYRGYKFLIISIRMFDQFNYKYLIFIPFWLSLSDF